MEQTFRAPGFVSAATGKKYDFAFITKIQKVEEQSDGTLKVYGVVTAERPDRDKQVCNYSKTKPYYQKTVAEMMKATDVPGMEQSIMPLREMHNLIAAGKGISIDFDDATKTVRMGFEVVNPDSIKKVKKGVLPCFSQGGNYVGELVPSTEFPGCEEYVADPGEVSLVDRGALPGAVIESMKGQSFPLTKRDGSLELVKLDLGPGTSQFVKLADADIEKLAEALKKSLAKDDSPKTKRVAGEDLSASAFAYVGDHDDTSTWKLPIKFSTDAKTKSHIRNALARFGQTQGIPADEKPKVKARIVAAAKQHGIEVAAEAEKLCRAIQYLQAATGGGVLAKGMWQVAQMAEILETISWLQQSAIYEREFENDASTQPEDMATLLGDAISCFTSMVEEETSELQERAVALSGKGAKAMTQEELVKAADDLKKRTTSVKTHLSNLHKAHTAFHDKATAMHKSHMDSCQETIGKCMKALDGEPVGDTDPGEKENNEDPTTGAPHQAAAGSEFVSVGKTAGGVEIFKRVPKAPPTTDELIKTFREMLDENTTSILTAVAAAMGGGAPELITKVDGVGDRSLVITGARAPMATIPVGKAADAVQNAGSQPTAVNDKPMTREEIEKAANGDPVQRLRLAKMARPATGDEAQRMDGNLATLVGRK